MSRLRIKQDGGSVLLIAGGRLIAKLPADAARQVADALRQVALRAEEWAKAESIAMDQAVLMRAGAGFGLTDHPVIQREAAKAAAWDRDLRRFMPGGIRSQTQVGSPGITQFRPRGHRHD